MQGLPKEFIIVLDPNKHNTKARTYTEELVVTKMENENKVYRFIRVAYYLMRERILLTHRHNYRATCYFLE